MRPGTASTFAPKDGIVQACKTSIEVTISRMCTLKGIIIRLSTSNRRNILFSSSPDGII